MARTLAMLAPCMFVLLLLATACSTKLPDEDLTVPELIKFWGYPVESHDVYTQDGYILTLHRIPHGRLETHHTPRPVMFLQHGLLGASSSWVVNLPHQSFGYVLADAGYDVWMGNIRGNTYSKKHRTYDITGWRYWQFSFEEHAKFDLPAMVDYALNTTGQSQLYYVGYSQGTTMAFAGLSENLELQKKIKAVYALAPVARLGNVFGGPLRFMANFEYWFRFIFKLFNIRNFLPSTSALKWLADKSCPLNRALCDDYTTRFYGLHNFNVTRKSIYMSHTPAGTSVRNMYHFMQLVQDEKFQKYDYGTWENLKKYKSLYPDEYDLTAIQNKVVLFYGKSDWLTHPSDVAWLSQQLPNVHDTVKIEDYDHFDFVWGLNAREKIYNRIIADSQL